MLSLLLIVVLSAASDSAVAQTRKSSRTKKTSVTKVKKEAKAKPSKKKSERKSLKEKEEREKLEGENREREKQKQKEEAVAVAQESAKVENIATMPKRIDFRAGVVFWNEVIEAQRNTTSGTLTTQSEGLTFTANKVIPYPTSRWSLTYGADFSVGFTKGYDPGGTFIDTLKNQRWFFFGGRVGLVKRTSPHTSFGFEVPAFMRMIAWELNDDTFKIDRESSFSVGVSFLYDIHFSSQSTLHLSMGNQYMWKSTLWTVAYERKIF